MTGWELTMYTTNVRTGLISGGASSIWTEKDKKTGLSAFDKLAKMANDGWELVAATPISLSNGATDEVLFTFKRTKEG